MKSISIFIFLLFSITAFSQQGRNFSMWYHNNYQHNPAAVGTNDHNLKAFVNFRYQYFTVSKKPFQTLSASMETKLAESKRSKNHLGLGASIINDMSGDGTYMVNDVNIPVAYHIYFDDYSSISLGVAPGIYQRSILRGNYTWESQWNGYEFNQGADPINLAGANAIRFDIGAGLMYKYESSATNKYYGGFSVRHISQPNIGFIGQDKLKMRFIGQFGMKHRFKLSNFGISPNVLAVFQGPNHDIVYGSNFDFYFRDASTRTIFVTPTHFSVGIYHRYGEGIILNFQYYFQGINIALAYDTNINSMIRTSKSVGAFELAFSYDIIFNKRGKFIY
ncbi:MAG: PorP/SprF family type IX secretion system membrane protein [Brumimicrobium sp.]|nr:PorP/SprF family type IX secretion system membrane protein [Brumimicrobium sp.]MCO5268574.1 PorP/SprF family type IX secretion system membrane protein [Brumimicrobium sp.]